MELIITIFSLVGSLALLLFGMKTMSEGLEKFARNRLRCILAASTLRSSSHILHVFLSVYHIGLSSYVIW